MAGGAHGDWAGWQYLSAFLKALVEDHLTLQAFLEHGASLKMLLHVVHQGVRFLDSSAEARELSTI